MTKLASHEGGAEGAVGEYLTGYCKSAALVGELTADYLDGMVAAMNKQAEGEMIPEAAMGGEGAAPAGAEGGAGLDDEAAALAEAAQELAAELGVSPEEILEAAMSDLGDEGAGDAGAEAPMEAPMEASMEAPMEAAAEYVEEAVFSDEEVNTLDAMAKKAAAYDELVARDQAEKAAAARKQEIGEAVTSSLEAIMAKKAAAESAAK
jgi:hypothetical protein